MDIKINQLASSVVLAMEIIFRNLVYKSLLVFLFLLLLSADSLFFKVSHFDPQATNILYQGDAKPGVGGTVELINNVDYLCRVGWATYAEGVRLWDSSTGKLSDFTTRFSFDISTQGLPTYGHGIAFFLAPAGFQIPPNSAGGFLGLFNTTTSYSAQNHMVHVEFDSFPNPEWDPSVQHVGINNNSLVSAVYTPWNASFHSGDTADVWITYNATTRNLSVSWNYQRTRNPQENSSLSYIIDLMRILPEWVTIGFSAATGQYVERHTLASWEFNSSLNVKETNGPSSEHTKIIVGVVVSGCALIVGLIAGVLIFSRMKQNMGKKGTEAANTTSINEDLEREAGPRRFSYEDLASATNNFSDKRKLGEGGFGAVYKGYLSDMDMAIAVKKISRGSKQGRKEYVTEVKTIGQLRHRNLVQLMGWCHDRGEFMLVYEFMPNGSLDSHLFGKKNFLGWAMRYRISLGLASALLYLHEEWEQCVVHRDVKSSNVMLDSSFNAKLGDFGLARLIDHEIGPRTTGLAGTLGYLAPEYIRTRRASKESDAYSFGVVALEIATGRKALDSIKEKPETGLVEWIWELYGCGKLLLAMDRSLDMDFDKKEAECLMVVGLWCAHPDRSLRASIRQAIKVLKMETSVPNLPAKMPVPTFNVPSPSVINVPSPTVGSGEPSITNTSAQLGR